ncbi:HepT-like ribonuclease domain-containing protein, partial [Rhizobium sp. BR5]
PWKQIRGIGNILRHEYHKIADDVVWAVVTEHVA